MYLRYYKDQIASNVRASTPQFSVNIDNIENVSVLMKSKMTKTPMLKIDLNVEPYVLMF